MVMASANVQSVKRRSIRIAHSLHSRRAVSPAEGETAAQKHTTSPVVVTAGLHQLEQLGQLPLQDEQRTARLRRRLIMKLLGE